MQADEMRFLFAYDRWATRRVLTVLGGLDPAVWTRTHVLGERGLGSILDHHLGASRRWRHGFRVVNHGTQHRAEAAALLTAEGRSTGELDLINYAEQEAEGTSS